MPRRVLNKLLDVSMSEVSATSTSSCSPRRLSLEFQALTSMALLSDTLRPAAEESSYRTSSSLRVIMR